MKFYFGFLIAFGFAMLLALAAIFWVINSAFFYNPRTELQSYADLSLSSSSTIDRFCPRNFFFLDGPDFYYELTLSPTDKAHLKSLFTPEREDEPASSAIGQLPSSQAWTRPSSRRLEHYHYEIRSARLSLDLDPQSNKAWLAMVNY